MFSGESGGGPLRLIHTADWHLGRVFHGINLLEDQAYILQEFLKLVKESGAQAVLLAGDVFDRSLPPADAVALLSEILTRLCLEIKVPTILIAGNHDNPERLGFAQQVLASRNLHMMGTLSEFCRPLPLHDRYGPVYFCPFPYAEPAFVRNFLRDEALQDHHQAMRGLTGHLWKQVPPQARCIALAHAFVNGCQASDSERPLSAVGGAGMVEAECFQRFHYTALGHLHRPQAAGSRKIRYAGSLLKYSFSEVEHRKAFTLLEIDAAGQLTHIEEVALVPRHDLRRVEGYLEDILKNAASDPSRNDFIQVILHDRGPLLDPMSKLRQVYPHVLDLQRIETARPTQYLGPGRDFSRLGDQELFGSFFAQVTGEALSDREQTVLTRLLEGFGRREREGSL